jgi:hypothetical protein
MTAHDHIFKNRQSCCCLHCIPAADAGIFDVPVVDTAAVGPSAVATVLLLLPVCTAVFLHVHARMYNVNLNVWLPDCYSGLILSEYQNICLNIHCMQDNIKR